MDLLEFLALRGTDLPSVVARVQEEVELRADDVLLAVGSLVEGLGNRKSDVDLFLISSRDGGAPPAKDEVGLVVGQCLVDLQLFSTAQIDDLLDRLRAWGQAPWDVTHPVQLTLAERTLLHRLLHSRRLESTEHPASDERLASLRPARADLARLKLQVARQLARTIQVDMVGYRECGDHRSLVFAAQDLLGQAVDALTAGHQLTHPVAKWRHRMLELLPLDWERRLVVRPTGHSAADVFWELHRAPELPERAAALAHAFRITTLARAVFAWSERRLRGSHAEGLPRVWRAPDRSPMEPPLPCLDFDVDFVLLGDRVMVARLNELGEAVELSPRELDLALLFDGVTTAREAEAVTSLCTTPLLAQLDRAGLLASPSLD